MTMIVKPGIVVITDSDIKNEILKLEDRLSEEGKYTTFMFGIVSLHGYYTAEDLTKILKILSTTEGQ